MQGILGKHQLHWHVKPGNLALVYALRRALQLQRLGFRGREVIHCPLQVCLGNYRKSNRGKKLPVKPDTERPREEIACASEVTKTPCGRDLSSGRPGYWSRVLMF